MCSHLRSLSLSGFSDTQIQKMGRWKSATFKTYIAEQLSNFTDGMSRKMKQMFRIVNIEGGAMVDVTEQCVAAGAV